MAGGRRSRASIRGSGRGRRARLLGDAGVCGRSPQYATVGGGYNPQGKTSALRSRRVAAFPLKPSAAVDRRSGPRDARQRCSVAHDRPESEAVGLWMSEAKPGASMTATITCPLCGHQALETMPTDACQFFYECKGCRRVLQPKPGDCCVFCSYADRPCPPKQNERSCSG
jgi:hypothetical protein